MCGKFFSSFNPSFFRGLAEKRNSWRWLFLPPGETKRKINKVKLSGLTDWRHRFAGKQQVTLQPPRCVWSLKSRQILWHTSLWRRCAGAPLHSRQNCKCHPHLASWAWRVLPPACTHTHCQIIHASSTCTHTHTLSNYPCIFHLHAHTHTHTVKLSMHLPPARTCTHNVKLFIYLPPPPTHTHRGKLYIHLPSVHMSKIIHISSTCMHTMP